MEPTNHPFGRENYLNQTSMIMFHVNLPGCIWVGEWNSFGFAKGCVFGFPRYRTKKRSSHLSISNVPMKNKGSGHPKTRLFTIKTSKHVGFGGPWYKWQGDEFNVYTSTFGAIQQEILLVGFLRGGSQRGTCKKPQGFLGKLRERLGKIRGNTTPTLRR